MKTPKQSPRTLLAPTAPAATAFGVSACGSAAGSSSSSGSAGVTLILKTLSNPYFVSMEQDAKTGAVAGGRVTG